MNQKQRTAQQRVMMRVAEGQLMAISEMFGTETEVDLADHIREQGTADYDEWSKKVQEFLDWAWSESPIA